MSLDQTLQRPDDSAPGAPGRRVDLRPVVDGAAKPLLTRHDTALLDLDGVLYAGPYAVPGAPGAVAAARAAGMRVAFVTNNASRTPEQVAAHLSALGVDAAPDDVVTSAQAAASLVAAAVPPGSAVLVVGGEGLHAALLERGLRPVSTADDAPAAVVQGFSPDVGWRLLAEGTYAVRTGVPWIASNLDVTVPTARGLAPGNGALVGVIERATGRQPLAAGKPQIALHLEAMRRTGARNPLVVGDRLDTDIEGANRAGVVSLAVLTGVTAPVDLVFALPERRPTYLARDVRAGLTRPHPQVRLEDDGRWRCRGWRCAVVADALEVSGSGEAIDGLRAACAAAWAADSALEPEQVESVLARLEW